MPATNSPPVCEKHFWYDRNRECPDCVISRVRARDEIMDADKENEIRKINAGHPFSPVWERAMARAKREVEDSEREERQMAKLVKGQCGKPTFSVFSCDLEKDHEGECRTLCRWNGETIRDTRGFEIPASSTLGQYPMTPAAIEEMDALDKELTLYLEAEKPRGFFNVERTPPKGMLNGYFYALLLLCCFCWGALFTYLYLKG